LLNLSDFYSGLHLKIVIDYSVNFIGIQVLPSQSFSHAIRGMLRGENQVHPSVACSEEKIRFTLLVNLFDFLKPFKGNTYMPAFVQTLFSNGNFGSLFLV